MPPIRGCERADRGPESLAQFAEPARPSASSLEAVAQRLERGVDRLLRDRDRLLGRQPTLQLDQRDSRLGSKDHVHSVLVTCQLAFERLRRPPRLFETCLWIHLPVRSAAIVLAQLTRI